MPSAEEDPSGLPPFAPARAAAVRTRLGLTLGQVAWAVAAYRGEPVHPSTVQAWETGAAVPDDDLVKALAAALWCSPVDLVGEARTLTQCRTVAGLSLSETATALGLTRARWEAAERRNHWQGNAAQTAALLRTLRPQPACFVAACGTTGRLRVLLREAVTGWWPNYTGPVGRIVPLQPAVIRHSLERLHFAYQLLEGSVGASTHAAAAADAEAADFLERIDLRLWDEVRAAVATAPHPDPHPDPGAS
ncbi:helix-turn-helix transcriptional regulator [Streptomyces sp. NPDC048606]|uniref:helix-turn-helix domain-containing protein n=1 Tax=Streptomyces sp. NPDC048606 TaxID=3154726 RepID=UPI0034173970